MSYRGECIGFKNQSEKELQTAKDNNKTLGILNMTDSEEVKQARAKLVSISLSVDEKNKQVDAECKK